MQMRAIVAEDPAMEAGSERWSGAWVSVVGSDLDGVCIASEGLEGEMWALRWLKRHV